MTISRVRGWLAGMVVGWLGLACCWVLPFERVAASTREVESKAAVAVALPNEACAECHKEIYERYRSSPMARASGTATDGFLPANFKHDASGVHYRIEKAGGQVYLDFERAEAGGAGQSSGDELAGRRELKYFLGSGKRGRTFLFEQDGYWFEIPINWYAKKRIWDMAPNYLKAAEMPLTLPVDPGCLRCHASGAQASLPEARNRYAGVPFTQGGITCTSCHDGAAGADASAHIASRGRVALAKIGELEPVKRDSVCLNCHLEGEEAVVHAGKRLVDFRPGESIFDYASFFVRAATLAGGERATSQWEALLQSGCRRGAGARLTCTSCHDPHGSTAGLSAGERVEFYRARCLACHDAGMSGTAAGPGRQTQIALDGKSELRQKDAPFRGKRVSGFGAGHHPENRDCAACHMPRATSNDIAHEQVTDHSIPRVALTERGGRSDENSSGLLVRVGDGGGDRSSGDAAARNPALQRDLGLAYAMSAAKGDRSAGEEAIRLLKAAEATTEADRDYELHGQLGFLDQISGDAGGAEKEYELALTEDSEDAFAAGNLALLKAAEHQYGAAMALWSRAFENDPVQLKAGMNLAIVECGSGRREAALGTLDRILSFSPDDGSARQMRLEIRLGKRNCGKR